MSAEGIDDTCRTGGDEELDQQGFDDEKHGGEGGGEGGGVSAFWMNGFLVMKPLAG